jgi:hypothetical protein
MSEFLCSAINVLVVPWFRGWSEALLSIGCRDASDIEAYLALDFLHPFGGIMGLFVQQTIMVVPIFGVFLKVNAKRFKCLNGLSFKTECQKSK